jgi:hypothetical protein
VTSPVVTQNLALPARAIPWTRGNGEMMLRIVGDAEPILRGHLNELADVTIVRSNGDEYLTFRGITRGYVSQGKMYIIIYFPRRLAPMWETILKESGDDGVPIIIRLLGVKKPSRRIKEGRRGGGV